MIAEEVAKQIPVRLLYVERDEDPRDYRVNFDRITALGFEPRMRLRDGIREIADAIASASSPIPTPPGTATREARTPMIPLSEPSLGGRELEYVTRCLTSGWISSNGEYVREMEKVLAAYLGVKHVVACNWGTSAIHISLMLSGVQPDDEVIVPTVTFIAPVNAVRYVDAWPVFVDCDEYCNMDVEGVRRFLAEECIVRDGVLTNRTTGRRVSAIVPVHVFGTSADMDPDPGAGRRVRPGGRRGRQREPRLALQGPDVRRPRAHRLPELQRQQDRHHRRRRRHPDRRRRDRPAGPLPHDPGQGGRRRVHPQQRRLQLPDEQRAGRARPRAAGDPRRADRDQARQLRPLRGGARPAPPPRPARAGAKRTAGSTPSCATAPT